MKIIEQSAVVVVGLPVRATWRALWTEMPRAWQQFIARRAEVAHPADTCFMDVSLSKTEDAYLQLVCRQVSEVDRIPPGMMAVEIPAQPYIYHRHVGPPPEIAGTFGQMYAWAREQGYEAGAFKLDRGYTVAGDEREHDLYIGLLPEKRWREVQAA